MLISATGQANATLGAALEQVKGINAEFAETAQLYREFRATTGLDSAHFIKGYPMPWHAMPHLSCPFSE
jgi:hypothetical protein